MTKKVNQQAPTYQKERIMEVAEKLFAEKGFAATSISNITEEAGVARALIYYYFKNKQELYRAIRENAGRQICEIANEARSSEGTAFDKLRLYMKKVARLFIDRPSIIQVAMRAEMERSSTPQLEPMGPPPDFEALSAIIDEGIENGEISKMDVKLVIGIIFGMVQTLVMTQKRPFPDLSLDLEESARFAISTLAHGIAADNKPE